MELKKDKSSILIRENVNEVIQVGIFEHKGAQKLLVRLDFFYIDGYLKANAEVQPTGDPMYYCALHEDKNNGKRHTRILFFPRAMKKYKTWIRYTITKEA